MSDPYHQQQPQQPQQPPYQQYGQQHPQYAQHPQYQQYGQYGQYPPPQYQQPPHQPPPDSAMWAHLAALLTFTAGTAMCCVGFLLAWVAPLCIRNNDTKNAQNPYVRHHGTQGLNWGITQVITLIFWVGLIMVTGPVGVEQWGWPEWVSAPVAGLGACHVIASIVFAIIGSMRAKRGELWSYPKLVAIRFVGD